MTSVLVYAGRHTFRPPPPELAAVAFDPEPGVGFVEDEAAGTLDLVASIDPADLDAGKLAPVQLRAVAYAEELPDEPTLDELVALAPVVDAATPVDGPGEARVGLPMEHLIAGEAYTFVLIADYDVEAR